MKIKLLNDNIILEKKLEETKTSGGLIVLEKSNSLFATAKVIASNSKQVKTGNTVIYLKSNSADITINNTVYVTTTIDGIIAVK